MTRFEEARAKLTKLVTEYKPTPGTKLCDHCALTIMAKADPTLGDSTYLDVKAQALGFTQAEAIGIMRGWDHAAGKRPCFEDYFPDGGDRDQREAGEALGEELFEAVKATLHFTCD